MKNHEDGSDRYIKAGWARIKVTNVGDHAVDIIEYAVEQIVGHTEWNENIRFTVH